MCRLAVQVTVSPSLTSDGGKVWPPFPPFAIFRCSPLREEQGGKWEIVLSAGSRKQLGGTNTEPHQEIIQGHSDCLGLVQFTFPAIYYIITAHGIMWHTKLMQTNLLRLVKIRNDLVYGKKSNGGSIEYEMKNIPGRTYKRLVG